MFGKKKSKDDRDGSPKTKPTKEQQAAWEKTIGIVKPKYSPPKKS